MMHRLPLCTVFWAVISFSILWSGCDDRSINAFEETDRLFSVYGVLDIDKNPNYIRVRDLNTPFLADSSVKPEITVVLEDLETGSETVLRDTIMEFSGQIVFNYIVEEFLEPRRAYHLVIERPDGAASTTNVTTPGITETEVEPVNDVSYDRKIDFLYKNVVKPEFVIMEVGLEINNGITWKESGFVKPLEHNENADEMFVSLSPKNLMTDVFPPSDYSPFIDRDLLSPSISCRSLDSGRIHIRYTHFGFEWDVTLRVGSTSTDLMESGDVKNGQGFLGAVRRDSFMITMDRETCP